MKSVVVGMTAVLLFAGASLGQAAEDKPAVPEAALLAEAVRRGNLDADAAVAITRWILYAKDDDVARGLIEALRSADLTATGPNAERWDATARAMAGLFESALGDAAARRRRDPARWSELAAVVDAAAPAIAEELRELPAPERETLVRLLRAVAPSATPTLPHLIQALRHQRPEVRRGAALALGAMGEAARPATAELRQALDDRDAGVRDAAADALRRIEVRPSSDQR
jgi:hypothetical protein